MFIFIFSKLKNQHLAFNFNISKSILLNYESHLQGNSNTFSNFIMIDKHKLCYIKQLLWDFYQCFYHTWQQILTIAHINLKFIMLLCFAFILI